MKKCSGCKIEKLESEFHRKNRNKDFLQNYCKDCGRKAQRKNTFKKVYQIDMAEYDRRVGTQFGKCLLCQKLSSRRLCVDHDHKTGRVRGLLCRGCNTCLGWVENNSGMINRIVMYITQPVS